jgi:phosphatidylinositol alpha-1,6-mannosyltransferase
MKISILHTNITSTGGIPRFNRNLQIALEDHESVTHVLNPEHNVKHANGNKVVFAWRVLQDILKNKPDLIILGHLHFAKLAPLLRQFTKKPIVCILHGIEAWTYSQKLQKGINSITSFWSVSQYTSKRFSSIYALPSYRVELIFNTLAPTWNANQAQPSRKPFFLSVCRLNEDEKYKGIDRMLGTVYKLKDLFKLHNFRYVIVSHGNDVHRHKVLSKEYGIQEVVDFQGKLSEERLQELYRDCYAFALPSSGEGFGIVYLEAMAYKKACIAHTDCGADDVVIHEHTGFQIHTDEELEKAISFLILNPKATKIMGVNGYALLQEKFIFPAFKKRINHILRTCVE